MKAKFVYESLSLNELDRYKHIKVDLNDVDYVYHWLTEGKLFDACYSDFKGDDSKFILKRGVIPHKPVPNYKLGYQRGICLTIDPNYFDPAFNEDGSCIVMDMNKLKLDYEFENLTDNGEAEIRSTLVINNWPNYCINININEKSFIRGGNFEGYKFRAINEWLPDELKHLVKTFKNLDHLKRQRK